jgi:ribosomal protein L31
MYFLLESIRFDYQEYVCTGSRENKKLDLSVADEKFTHVKHCPVALKKFKCNREVSENIRIDSSSRCHTIYLKAWNVLTCAREAVIVGSQCANAPT